MTPSQESDSRQSLFDITFDRLGVVEGYLTTARRSAARCPATNPRDRQIRAQAEGQIENALSCVQAAVDELIALERGEGSS